MIATDTQVWERLNAVIDPEVGIGIVDLGLVYDVTIDDGTARITMTMTTPACPLGAYIEQSVQAILVGLADDVRVDIVFDPPWSPDRITATGREQLGWPS